MSDKIEELETEEVFEDNQQSKELASIRQLATIDHILISDTIVKNIKDGNLEPLEMHMFLKRMEKMSEIVKKDEEVKQAIVDAASLYGDKAFDYLGATLKVGPVYTTYNFEDCNDPLWENLNEIAERFKVLRTEREKFLKAAFPDSPKFGFKAPRLVIDTLYTIEEVDCGEEVVINQPRKIQQEGVKVTFKKK